MPVQSGGNSDKSASKNGKTAHPHFIYLLNCKELMS